MKKRGRFLDYLTLGFILILTELSVFSHIRFSLEFDRIFGRDWPIHLITAFKIFHCHFSLGKILLLYKNLSLLIIHYPPFNYLLSAGFWEILKFPPLSAVYASKALWIFFSALAMYGAGRALGGSGWSGIIAAVLGILNGLMLEMAREVSLEFVVPASFSLVIYGYALSQGYQKLFGSIVLGIVLGIGLLSKSVLFVFATPFLVFAFFFSPFEKETSFIRRLVCAASVASIALGIASIYYLNFFPQILSKAQGETSLVHVAANFGRIFAESYPFIISPLILLLAIIAIILQIKNRDSFLIPIFASLVISSFYMMTAQSLGSTYLLTFRIIFALIIVRGLRYISDTLRFILAALIIIVFYMPLLTNKSPINNHTFKRFIYPYDKPVTGIVVAPRNQGDFDWESVDRFAILFKNRYAQYGYRDIGYVLAGGMIHIPNIALALVSEEEPWSGNIKWEEDVIDISMDKNDYNQYRVNTIRAKKLIIFSLPDNTLGEPYALMHQIYSELKDERTVDFSFPIHWGIHLPGDYKILMLTKKQP